MFLTRAAGACIVTADFSRRTDERALAVAMTMAVLMTMVMVMGMIMAAAASVINERFKRLAGCRLSC
jgi:hypothetical protein